MARLTFLILLFPTVCGLRPFFFKVRSSTARFQYGKGTDIWPPTNDGPVNLADSFPNGQIPENVANLLNPGGSSAGEHPKPMKRPWKEWIPRAIDRILRRAATREEEQVLTRTRELDRTPLVVALSLLWFVQPLDLLLVTFLSGYVCLLTRLSMGTGGVPNLPALPPQGHVPSFISNPLGYRITNSVVYERWLKLGVLTGLIAPLLWIGKHALMAARSAGPASVMDISLAARPLFLLSCQAVTESLTRSHTLSVPLPIRILVPVAYNSIRLPYLYKWALCPQLGTVGRLLAVLQLSYSFLNLFGFLLPIAVLKYMRAHFFAVEAEQVITRKGMEETLGMTTTTVYYRE